MVEGFVFFSWFLGFGLTKEEHVQQERKLYPAKKEMDTSWGHVGWPKKGNDLPLKEAVSHGKGFLGKVFSWSIESKR